MSECDIIKSKRGKDILVYNGYSYHLHSKRDTKHYWRCVMKYKSSCNVVIATNYIDNTHTVISRHIEHGHLPDPEKPIAMKLINSIKEKANYSMDTPSQIAQRCIQDIPTSSAPYMPNKESMRMLVHRERNRNLPLMPNTVEDINIPEEYTQIDYEPFLIAQFIDRDVGILVFTNKNNCRLLNAASYWLMDGTFKTCPAPFVQMYTIHALIGTTEGRPRIVPLVYGLLSHKSEDCYSVLFELLKRYVYHKLNTNLAPKLIITNFEIAAINAIKKKFRGCINKLCFFHLNQSIWRHIQASGLAKRYGKDSAFAHKMRHLAALAFLEPSEIPDAFDMISNEVIPTEAEEVLIWFEKYYVRGAAKISKHIVSSKMTLSRQLPQFPPSMWSVIDSHRTEVPLSQNALESWHNRWNILLGRRKNNIYKTISEMIKEQKIRTVSLSE
jgi:hypothetical protein